MPSYHSACAGRMLERPATPEPPTAQTAVMPTVRAVKAPRGKMSPEIAQLVSIPGYNARLTKALARELKTVSDIAVKYLDDNLTINYLNSQGLSGAINLKKQRETT